MSDVLIDRRSLTVWGVRIRLGHDEDAAGAIAKRGMLGRGRARNLCAQERTRMDAEDRLKGYQPLREEADADLGRRPSARSTSTTSSTSSAPPRSRRRRGKTFPSRSVRPTSASASPRAERQRRRRCRRPVRVRGRLPPDPRGPEGTGRHLHGHRHGPARAPPEFFEEYFGTVIPAGDNKFAALNTAVWSGGSFVYVP